MGSLIALSPLVALPFLGHPLSSTLVYIWSRRNPDTRLSFLGIVVFSAPWLPLVLMGFGLVVHGTVPKDELIGVLIGHVWYFFNDVYPPLHAGAMPLAPPAWWNRLWEGTRDQEPVENQTNDDVVPAAVPDMALADAR